MNSLSVLDSAASRTMLKGWTTYEDMLRRGKQRETGKGDALEGCRVMGLWRSSLKEAVRRSTREDFKGKHHTLYYKTHNVKVNIHKETYNKMVPQKVHCCNLILAYL